MQKILGKTLIRKMNIYELILLGFIPLFLMKLIIKKLSKTKVSLVSLGKENNREQRLYKLVVGLQKQGWIFKEKDNEKK